MLKAQYERETILLRNREEGNDSHIDYADIAPMGIAVDNII